ncbi:MAG: Wzz/FepE/Etk N-terminal domain-containing protein, partial [Pseudomonadota bacterium]
MQVPVGQNGFVPPTPYDDEDRIEIRDLFSALLRQKTKIIAATFLGGLITYLIVSQITPRYEARSAVMIDPRTVQVLSEGQLVPGANINDALLYTEVSVLRSNLHLQKVIATIPDEMLANFDPASKPPGMMSRARSAISDGVERLLVQIGMAEAQPVDEPVFLLSPEERRMRRLVGALRSGLQVYREGDSYIITVIVETEFPALSALFADRILDVYIDEQIALRVDAVRGASQYIAERVAQSRSEVEAAEKAAETLRAEQISLTGVSVEAMERQRIELSTQLSLARAELATARSRFQQIEGLIEEEGIASAAELLSSPFVLSLRQQLYEDGRRD